MGRGAENVGCVCVGVGLWIVWYGGTSLSWVRNLDLRVSNLYAVDSGRFRSAGRQYDRKFRSCMM